MPKRSRLKRFKLVPLTVRIGGKEYGKIKTKEEFEKMLKKVDRSKQKVKLE